MNFVPITHNILFKLYQKGYNVLRSRSSLNDPNPIYYPDTIDIDIIEEIIDPLVHEIDFLIEEKHHLNIKECFLRDEQTLVGVVFITDEDIVS